MACDALIADLRDSPAKYQQLIKPAPSQVLTWTPDGSWSIAAVVMHIAITDLYYRRRFETIVVEHEPNIAQIRAEELVPPAGNPITPTSEMLERWQRVRSELCDWLATLSESDWQRVAFHPVRGRVTLISELELILAHDHEHMAQISCVLQAWEERRQPRLTT
jgi:uncharacterized damage-inducible protein DinB